ncbi:MAG TPA: SusC/RagA family TonB-linked outer membrane protein [Saprospiraceae bacterium]|nr:SusC/RagA family TonB-linked outer membrane protein [Saprospiraceae bacterium]HMQ84183.1 SusC/RagA family TonB-linked outer membrane protein [Saprospiraceae bacterium]
MKLKVNYLKKWGLLVFALSLCQWVAAQRTITGTVTDSNTGEPLIGANILVVGTSTGTITDFDGAYSLNVGADATSLEISYTGYTSQTITIGNQSKIDVLLSAGQLLDEVVVVGYGSQKEKEITSSVTSVGADEFNRGPITDPAQLLQGKVAGLQVYNKGGNPNQQSVIRLRGISTVGANTEPLVVVDGIIGASLENVDPNDIENITVLKDGSAAAIYGSRGSSGVILVTTRSGKKDSGRVDFTYNGQVGVSSAFNSVPVMSADEFVATGGTDLGASTDWIDEVTRAGLSNVHSLAASGGAGNTSYRISGNYRNVEGILNNSGFDQFNARLNFTTKTLNDRVTLDFNSSFTNRNSNYGFNEALRYAVLYNPTAPVLGADSPFPFASDQYGGYFETLGLFDSFNPVSISEQNRNEGKRNEVTYGGSLSYKLTDNLSVTGRIAQQNTTLKNTEYYPTTSLFRGNAASPTRKGRADFYDEITGFKLYEAFGTYINNFGKTDLSITAGYSYQQNNFQSNTLSLGDFPDDSKDFSNLIETSQDLQNAGLITASSDASPDERIIAFFGRANLTFDNAIFLNASVRREGSTKLGEENQWGIFPAFGVGVDLNNYLSINNVDLLKVRVGYGVTGSLPTQNGLSQEQLQVVNGADGSVSTEKIRKANPDLKWEEKAELNLGLEFAMGRFNATLDVYNRDITDFILEVAIDAATNEGFGTQFRNAGKLNTQGLELTLGYDVLKSASSNWTTGLILSTYKTVLDEFTVPLAVRGSLGAPGQNNTNMIRVAVGEEVGQIWGPVFAGVADNGAPIFEDVNGDGIIVAGQDKALEPDADFEVLGNGIPDLELGWSNQLTFGTWSINAFFRGAFGHSLVNTFRAFYEPIISTQSSYNYVNTELRIPELTTAQFSSLYVEKADYFKLDNLTIAKSFDFGKESTFRSMTVSLTGQNLLVITNYTGSDPEPSLVDYGSADNGGDINFGSPDVLSPGIDRRYNYFSSRTFTLGVNLNF